MKRASFEDIDCSIAQTLEHVGEWWTLLIVRDLFRFKDLHRFEEIQADLGIARNILSDRLTRLVDVGIVEKRRYQERPERFEYHLTPKGVDLMPVILTLMAWGDKYGGWDAGPPVVLHHQTCDHDTRAIVACSHCGEELEPRGVRARAAEWAVASAGATRTGGPVDD
jgi:DNA-binding HxlR family transcriptional regulator